MTRPEAAPPRAGRSSLWRIVGHMRPYAVPFGAAVLLAALAAATEAFGLLLLIPMLRSLFGAGPVLPEAAGSSADRLIELLTGGLLEGVAGLDALRIVCVLVGVSILLKNAFLYVSRILSIRVREWTTRDVRDFVFAHLQRRPLTFFHGGRSGQLVTRVLTDTRDASRIPEALFLGVRHAAAVGAFAAGMLFISWRLSLLAFGLAPVLVISLRPVLRHLRAWYRRAFNDQGEILGALQETVGGIRLVKGYGAEGFEDARFARRSDRFTRAFIKSATTGQLASPLSEILAALVSLSLIWFGAGLVLSGGVLGPEAFLAFVTLALRSIPPIKGLAQCPALAQQGLAAADRFFEIVDGEREPPGGSRTIASFEREIALEGVSFAYDREAPVLRDVSVTIARGEVVALVGPSGSGKSTLVDLLPRFIDPDEGRVTIDGTDIRDLATTSLRRLIGLVSQETTIFHDSVHANIAYADPDRSRAEVEAAARTAHAHEFVSGFPDGYDTVLGDRGVRLSGGERQRIGIARAVLRDAPILVLDEATSALDSESERLVKDALEDLFRGRTVILIAHRLSTVIGADRIVVLEEGRLVGEGTHEQLFRAGGTYARIFEHQLHPAITS